MAVQLTYGSSKLRVIFFLIQKISSRGNYLSLSLFLSAHPPSLSFSLSSFSSSAKFVLSHAQDLRLNRLIVSKCEALETLEYGISLFPHICIYYKPTNVLRLFCSWVENPSIVKNCTGLKFLVGKFIGTKHQTHSVFNHHPLQLECFLSIALAGWNNWVISMALVKTNKL